LLGDVELAIQRNADPSALARTMAGQSHS